MASVAVPATTERFDALTGLRGLGAVWVVLFHAYSGVNTPLIRDGYLGVDLFFILSGVVLAHVYRKKFAVYTPKEHVHFLLVRLARIYPLHLLALVVLGVIVLAVPGMAQRYSADHFTAWGWVISALLLQNFSYKPEMWNTPAWSLSAEWVAYIAFPFGLPLVRRFKDSRLALSVAMMSLLFTAAVFIFLGRGLGVTGKGGFIRLAGEFTAGCLLYRAYSCGIAGRLPRRLADWSAIALVALLVYSPFWQPVVIVAFGAIVVSVICQASFLRRALTTKPLLFLGEISYSVYALHWILLQLRNTYGDFVGFPSETIKDIVGALMPVVSIAVGWITWKFVELPARSSGRKIADHFQENPKRAADSAGG